jgi:hypothetical protein
MMSPAGPFVARADDRGRARLTLPTEGGQVDLGIREADPLESREMPTGLLPLRLDWAAGFRPDELVEIALLDGNDRRFRFIDADARSAVLHAPETIQAVKKDGRLVIMVTVPFRDPKDFGAFTGEIQDDYGQPIVGAHVVVGAPGARRTDPGEPRHQATTDLHGRYRLRDIPRRAIDGTPLDLSLMVTTEGYAGV